MRDEKRTTDDEHDKEHQENNADDNVGSNDTIDVVGVRGTRSCDGRHNSDRTLANRVGDA
jgi:hypothetical protein